MASAEKRDLTLPACLIVMDGFGLAEPGDGNAISLASTPVLDELFGMCSKTVLDASGEPVGLPDGQMGNSEVGHLNIGAGRVVYQLSLIHISPRLPSCLRLRRRADRRTLRPRCPSFGCGAPP